MASNNNSWLHIGLSIFGLVCAVSIVTLSVAVSVVAFGKGCDGTTCQSMLFLTTTFYSGKRIETNLGFPVATERDLTDSVQLAVNDPSSASKDRLYRFGHHIECMYTARMADKTCSPSLSLNDYTTCVQNNSALLTGLDTCASFPTVGGYSHWPTSEEYLACLWNNPLLQNSEVRRASQNVFRACMEQSLWPFFEIPQGIDSPLLFGSYNWILILLAGMVVTSSFSVYTCSPYEEGTITKGESGAIARLGMLWSGAALLWNIIYFIVFILIAFRNSGEFQQGGGLPTTATTTFITILVMAAAVFYFLAVILRPAGRRLRATAYHPQSDTAVIEPVSSDSNAPDYESHGLLQSTFPDSVGPSGQHVPARQYTLSDEEVAIMYTPPMLAIWSDSYFADFCFFLGFAGATGQLTTDVAWHVFSLVFVYRILGMIISRCMTDAFTNNVRLDERLNKAKNSIVTRPSLFFYGRGDTAKTHFDVHLNTKVIGLSTQLAALFLYASLIYLLLNENSVLNDFAMFKSFVWLCFIVPEGLRLLIHLYYQLAYNPEHMGQVPWMLYNSFFFVYLWDIILRFIFVCVLMYETSNNPGTFDFLKTQTNALMRDYFLVMTG